VLPQELPDRRALVIAFDFLRLTRYLIHMNALQQLLCCALTVMLSFTAKGEQSDVYPKTVTLKTDVVLPVPFAVAESIVTAKAGADVTVKSVHGDQVKVAYGVGEGLVPIEHTDFVARLPQAQQEAEAKKAELKRAEAARPRPNPFDTMKLPATEQSTDLVVESWNWSRSAGGKYYEAVGEIRNTSRRKLEFIQVELTTRNANGDVVNSDTAVVRDHSLEPGQRTRFQVLVRVKGGERSAGLAFRRLYGDRYSHRE
jgi:hypothetical protein